MSISIVIADDHTYVRQGLKSLLETQDGFTIQGEARDGVEAVEFCEHLQPDVLILDISMPRLNGLDAISLVHQVSSRTRIIIFSNHASQDYAQKALNAGAFGYVLKDPEDIYFLVQAIREVNAGARYISPRLL